MTDFVLEVQGLQAMTGTLTLEEQAERPLWRVKHDVERPKGLWRPRLPEIFRIEPDHHVVFNAAMQWLWYRLNWYLSGIEPLDWRKLGGNALYLFNGGHGFPGHADHVNGIELNRPDPRAPQMLICGGAIVTGRVGDGKLYLDGIDTRKPLPSVEEVIERKLYYTNVTVQADGSIGRFPQGDGRDTFTPLFYGNSTWDEDEQAYLFLSDLDFILPGERIPSAYEVPA